MIYIHIRKDCPHQTLIKRGINLLIKHKLAKKMAAQTLSPAARPTQWLHPLPNPNQRRNFRDGKEP